jgi:uncharacterized protein (TIGR03067 family)
VQSLEPVASYRLPGRDPYMAFSGDGQDLLITDDDNAIYRWKYDPSQFGRPTQPTTAADRLAMLDGKQKNQHLDNLPKLPLSKRAPICMTVRGLVMSPDGRWIVSQYSGLVLWHSAAFDLVESTTPRKHLTYREKYRENVPNEFDEIAFSPDSRYLANSLAKRVDLWDVQSGNHVRELQSKFVNDGSDFSGIPLSFSRDSKYLAAGRLQVMEVWEAESSRQVFSVNYKGSRADLPVAFSPSGNVLATLGRENGNVMLVDLKTGKPTRSLLDPTRRISDKPTQEIGDPTRQLKKRLLPRPVLRLQYSKDGRFLVSGHECHFNGVVTLWDAASGKWVRNFVDLSIEGNERNAVSHAKCVVDVAFSPDGQIVASTDEICLKLWDTKTGSLIHTVDGNFGRLAFSADGQSFATSNYHEGRIWDTASLQIRVKLGTARDVAFSDDGRYFAVSIGKSIALFDGELFDGLSCATPITFEQTRWIGRALTRLGYLKPASGINATVFSADDGSHVAFTLPKGAATDEVIVASLRDEVGPALTERFGPKLTIHLCTENFQVERTIDVERPVGAAVPTQPNVPKTAATPTPPITTPAVQPPKPVNELLGTWQTKKMQVDGRPAKFNKTTTYRFQDKRLVIQAKDAPTADRSYSVETSTDPHQLDVVLHGRKGDALSQMIYKIEGDILTVCYPPAGKPRPTDFAPREGAKHTVIVFRRVTDVLPLDDGK